MRRSSWRRVWLRTVAGLGWLCASACGEQLDVGSDLLWTARFEGDSFVEWTSVTGGGTFIAPSSNLVEPTSDRVHQGKHAAKVTITTPADGSQATANLVRSGNLPDEAFYSSWYYLPQTAQVGGYWVLMKFRMRTTADDPTSDTELYDIDLKSLASGEMALMIYDHSQGKELALSVTDPVVPAGGTWFQIEAFYRDASDATGRLTVWLDGKEVADVVKPTGTPGWVEWDAGSVGESLTPQTVTVYVDDCAISRTRVGPAGRLAM